MAAEKYKIIVAAGDVNNRFTVPENWLQILEKRFVNGGNEVLLRAEDWLGFCHEFRCAVRKVGPYNKPVLQAHEWNKFVKYAGLRVGDKIILQELDDREAQFRGSNYRIIAQRKDRNGLWANFQIPQRADPEFHHFF